MNDIFLGIATFAFISAVGYLIYSFSLKLSIPPALSLLVVGFFLGIISRSAGLFPVGGEIVSVIAILALIVVVFSDTSKFEIQSVNHFSVVASRLSLSFTFLNIIFMVFLVSLFFFGGFELWYVVYASIFALIVSGTDITATTTSVKNKSDKVLEILMSEGMLNTPITVLLPFFLIEIIRNALFNITNNLWSHLGGIIIATFISIGVGVFLGIIFFSFIKSINHEKPNFFFVLIAALLSFSIGELLGGSGVLSVGVLGLLFGSAYLKDKDYMHDFNITVSESLEIIVVLLAGFIIQLRPDWVFILKSFILFLALISARYLAIKMSVPSLSLNGREKSLLALVMPKGISVAALALMLWSYGSTELNLVSELLIMMIFYSLIFSVIFLRRRVRNEPEAHQKTVVSF